MSELKNLLIVKSQSRMLPETVDRIHEILNPIADELNSKVIVADGFDVEFYNNALLARIDGLIDINQALLEYMISADSGESAPTLGAHL